MSNLDRAPPQADPPQQARRPPTPSNAPPTPAAALSFEPEMLDLYRSLDNVFPDLHHKVIMFLGAKGGEGTSTVVSSLARLVAERLNRTVAILDANTLHPTQQQLFGITPVIGWDDVLSGAEPAEAAIYQTNREGLFVIPVSSAKTGPTQVINAPGMESLFAMLRERFDLVLIDCAAAILFPGSITLSRNADGVVLVIEAESTRWPVAAAITEQITEARGRVIGIVLNKRRYYIPEFIYRRL